MQLTQLFGMVVKTVLQICARSFTAKVKDEFLDKVSKKVKALKSW